MSDKPETSKESRESLTIEADEELRVVSSQRVEINLDGGKADAKQD